MSQPPTARNDRPQAVRQQTLNASLEISQSPWPPPDVIERYEIVFPGSAERLVRLVEQEAEHRRALESRQLRSEIVETHIGQWMAFFVALFTPTSVACADSATATSSVKALTYSSSVTGWGLASRRREKICTCVP